MHAMTEDSIEVQKHNDRNVVHVPKALEDSPAPVSEHVNHI